MFLGSKIDRSKVPKLVEKDIEEKYIRGIIENDSVWYCILTWNFYLH